MSALVKKICFKAALLLVLTAQAGYAQIPPPPQQPPPPTPAPKVMSMTTAKEAVIMACSKQMSPFGRHDGAHLLKGEK